MPSSSSSVLLPFLAAAALSAAQAKTPIPWHREDPNMREYATWTHCTMDYGKCLFYIPF